MKTKRALELTKLAGFFLLLSTFHYQLSTFAQSTAFTYQGRVMDNGTNFTGLGQFKFALVTSTNTSHRATATAILTGTFVTGYNVTFAGNGYLTPPAITISGGGGSGATAHATISGGSVTAVIGDSAGTGYTSPPSVAIAPPPSNIAYTTYWSIDGSSVNGSEPSTYVSTGVNNGLFTIVLGDVAVSNMAAIDPSVFAQPNLQLRIWFNDGANGFVALNPAQNLTPVPFAVIAQNLPGFSVQQNTNGTPNMIGGSTSNFVAAGVMGATISGGGTTNFAGTPEPNSVIANYGTVGGGIQNTAGGFSATVGGGADNAASAGWSFVGGGAVNIASGTYSVVGGGANNHATGGSSFVGGGEQNTASDFDSAVTGGEGNVAGGSHSAVGGGGFNHASGAYATVPGGAGNLASALYSFAAGVQAQAVHDGSFVWADWQNTPFASSTSNSFNVRAQGGVQFVTGGAGMTIDGLPVLTGNGSGLLIQQNSNGAPNVIEGAAYNFVANGAVGATIGGGGATNNLGSGLTNSVTADYGTVGGGEANTSGRFGTVAGGGGNTAAGNASTVSGGASNSALAAEAAVGGGANNVASAAYATVPGGFQNSAAGAYSFAAGRQAAAMHNGAFVWADSQNAAFTSTASDQFNVRAQGGVRFNDDTSLFFGTGSGRQMLNLWGTQYGIGVQSYTTYFRTDSSAPGGGFAWYQGGVHNDSKTNSGGGITLMTLDSGGLHVNGTFVSSSDRNVKQDFGQVNSRAIFEKVAQLPIQTWAYTNDPGTKHLGPVAQDFYAAFHVGPDDRHITVVDEGGVALAAIQGLNQKLEAGSRKSEDRVQKLEQELERKQTEITELKQRLDALEKIIHHPDN